MRSSAFLFIVYSAAVNICAQIFVWTCVSISPGIIDIWSGVIVAGAILAILAHSAASLGPTH